MIKFENRNKMGNRNSLNGQTLDHEQPRSLEDSGIYSIEEVQQPGASSSSSQYWQPERLASSGDSGITKEDGQTDIGSASGEMLVKNTRDDHEGHEISDGACTAQKPVQDTQGPAGLHVEPRNDRHLVASDALLDRMSDLISKAKEGTANADVSQVVRNSYKIFNVAVALKENAKELMNRFSFHDIHADRGNITETTTFDNNETKVTVTSKSLYQSCRPKNRLHVPVQTTTSTAPVTTNTDDDVEMPPVDDYPQDAPDTYDVVTSMYTSGFNADMYEAMAEARPPAEEKTWERERDRILANHRVHKRIELELVDHLLFLSKCVGTVMMEYHPPEATITGGVNQTKTHIYGTCFRLGSKYVLTNKHVVDMANLTDCKIAFNRYPPGPVQFPIEQIKFTCRDLNLDYSVLELAIPSRQFQEVLENLPGLGHLVRELGKGQKVTLIGHDDGDPMSMDPSCHVVSPLNWYEFMDICDINKSDDAFLLCHPGRVLYRSDFGQGSSGSQVFDDKGYLVGMHTCSFPTNGPRKVEQMVRMTAIRDEIGRNDPELCYDLFFGPKA